MLEADLQKWLEDLCEIVNSAECEARQEQETAFQVYRLLIEKKDKVEIRIHKESSTHTTPHFHVSHSDRINASIRIDDFSVLAGKIDNKTLKRLTKKFLPHKQPLLDIWESLKQGDCATAHKLIQNFY